MISLLAARNLTLKPWRTLFLLFGFSIGVATMIVLLSVGEALLDQGKDEKLIGGGSITVLPEGVNVEVLKTGGLGGMFFSIDHARFIQRQLLASSRTRDVISAVSPQIGAKLVYLRLPGGREIPIRAEGDIPSLTQAVGAGPTVLAGAWSDDTLDRLWRAPTAFELRNEIDHFHLPPPAARNDPGWAEWHYFNVITPDRKRWLFVSFIIAGNVTGADSMWGGQVLVTAHEQGKPERRFTSLSLSRDVRFSTTFANLRIGDNRVEVLPNGNYAVHAVVRENGNGPVSSLDLEVAPASGAYFPGAAITSGVVSGYVVPGLRANATGTFCITGICESLQDVQAYHDHNWGVWRGVTWEWGAARAGQYTFLYGRVQAPDSLGAPQPLFVYVIDSLGFTGVFRPRTITYSDGRTTIVNGRSIRTPSSAEMTDVQGADTVRIRLTMEDATATDTRLSMIERGDALTARALTKPFFVQMKGVAEISGRLHGQALIGNGAGFFETYR